MVTRGYLEVKTHGSDDVAGKLARLAGCSGFVRQRRVDNATMLGDARSCVHIDLLFALSTRVNFLVE